MRIIPFAFLVAVSLGIQIPQGIYGTFSGTETEVTSYFYGNEVSINSNGKVFAVGFPGADVSNGDTGKVYIYNYISGTSWTTTTLSKTASGGQFGKHIALSKDGIYLIAAAPYNAEIAGNAGKVFLYKYSAGSWSEVYSWSSSTAETKLGNNVAISANGDRVFICTARSDNVGTVEIYTNNNNTWPLERSFVNPTGIGTETFCNSISVTDDGSRVLVGSPSSTLSSYTQSGKAILFKRTNTTWAVEQTFDSPFTGNYNYGQSVSITGDGTRLAIAAPLYTGAAPSQGIVRTFVYSGGTYAYQENLTESAPTTTARFGYDISYNYDGTKLLVGIPYSDTGGTNTGMIRVYYKALADNFFTNFYTYQATTPVANNLMGWDVAVSSDGVSISASEPAGDISAVGGGNAWVIKI